MGVLDEAAKSVQPVTFTRCQDCGGTRLNEGARSSWIRGINIAEACAMQITDLAAWVRGVPYRWPLAGCC